METDQRPAEDVRQWAHRVLDELIDETRRQDFYGTAGLELTVERGVLTSVVRRYAGRVKPPKPR